MLNDVYAYISSYNFIDCTEKIFRDIVSSANHMALHDTAVQTEQYSVLYYKKQLDNIL